MLSVAPFAASRSRGGAYVPAIVVAHAQRPTPIGQLTGTPAPVVQGGFLRRVGEWEVASLRSGSTTGLSPNMSGYQASIDWGDGTNTAGRISVDDAGTIHILGEHEYTLTGSFEIRVTVTPGHRAGARGAWSKTILSSATVTPYRSLLPMNALIGGVLQGIAGQPVHGSLVEAYIPIVAATIDWGDGSAPEAGTIEWLVHTAVWIGLPVPGPSCWVIGTHTYQQAGTYDVTVTVQPPPPLFAVPGGDAAQYRFVAVPEVVHATVIISPATEAASL